MLVWGPAGTTERSQMRIIGERLSKKPTSRDVGRGYVNQEKQCSSQGLLPAVLPPSLGLWVRGRRSEGSPGGI